MHGKRCFNRPHHFSPLREDGGGLSKQEISEKPMYCGGWPGYGKKIHGGGSFLLAGELETVMWSISASFFPHHPGATKHCRKGGHFVPSSFPTKRNF